MNRQSLARLTVMAIVCGFLTMFAVDTAHSQPETVYFTYQKLESKAVFIKLPIGVEPPEFLEDPTKSMRQKGLLVPQPAEAPWREVADYLRRLTELQKGQSNAGRKPSGGSETLTYQIRLNGLPGGVRVAVADLDNVSPQAGRISIDEFLNNPIKTLRAHGVRIPPADERAWKQLVDALRALQLAYAKPRAKLERQTPEHVVSIVRQH